MLPAPVILVLFDYLREQLDILSESIMDPLSVASGVIGLIQAANAVVSFCFDFRNAYKDNPSEMTTLLTEIIQLRSVVENLRNLAEKVENDQGSDLEKGQFLVLRGLCQPGGAIKACEAELYELLADLTPGEKTHRVQRLTKAFAQAMKWQLKGEDMRKAVERLERYKSTFSLVLNMYEV